MKQSLVKLHLRIIVQTVLAMPQILVHTDKLVRFKRIWRVSKGTAAQSGMFRQLTGGLESVITAIVDAMPSNVHLYTGTLVSNIRYVEGMYAIDVENSGNDACGCQSHSKSIRTASINAENRVEAE